MYEKKGNGAMFILRPLLALVVLTTVPGLGVAQTCPDKYPNEITSRSGEIMDGLQNAHAMSKSALDYVGDVLKMPKEEKTGYDGFLERLLMNTVITKAASFVPGGNLAQSTMIGFYANARGSRQAEELNELLADYEWLDRERAKLEAIYDFAKDPAKLKCAHAAQYAKLGSAEEQRKYLNDMQDYSSQIGGAIKSYHEVSLDMLLKWVNDNYEFKRAYSNGLLVLKLNIKNGNLPKSQPKLVGPSVIDNVAKKLNELMAILELKPFDLKIRKMILIRGVSDPCASCEVMFMLDANNNFIEKPTYNIDATAVYHQISQNNFGSYNVKFGN